MTVVDKNGCIYMRGSSAEIAAKRSRLTPPAPRPTEALRESIVLPPDRSYLIRRDDYPHPLCTWNYHPEWEIHYIPEARGFAYVGDHIGSFEPGTVSLCGRNLPHNWVSPGLVAAGRLESSEFVRRGSLVWRGLRGTW